jgi:uncharacterized protein (DUF362 family)
MGTIAVMAAPRFERRHSQDLRKKRSRVAILKTTRYSQDLEAVLMDGLRLFSLDLRGKSVLLRPNCVETVRDKATSTSPVLVSAAVECFRRLGAAKVTVGEGPGHQRDTELAIFEAGLTKELKDHQIPFVDLNRDELVKTRLSARYTGLSHLWFPKTVLESDIVVSLPKVKTHHWVGVTLSMKNMFGIVAGIKYGWPKNILHWKGIDNSILDICATVPVNLVIADGIVGMEGNGPLHGENKNLGVIVISDDPVAADATTTRLMGLLPEKVRYFREAGRFLGNIDPKAIEQLGEPIQSVRQSFKVVPAFKLLLDTS